MDKERVIIQFEEKACRKLQRQLENLYKESVDEVVIDLRKTVSLSSPELGTLVYYHTLLTSRKNKLVIIIKNDEESFLYRLFQSTNLNLVLNIMTK